jgi:hypothetical protein
LEPVFPVEEHGQRIRRTTPLNNDALGLPGIH